MSKHVKIERWKKLPLVSKNGSISPNIRLAVLTSGRYTGELKGPFLEKPTTKRTVCVLRIILSDASNSKVYTPDALNWVRSSLILAIIKKHYFSSYEGVTILYISNKKTKFG
jgi:hypothetical protein